MIGALSELASQLDSRSCLEWTCVHLRRSTHIVLLCVVCEVCEVLCWIILWCLRSRLCRWILWWHLWCILWIWCAVSPAVWNGAPGLGVVSLRSFEVGVAKKWI